MKQEDLIEFLSSVIEEDAIIARIYKLFHSEYNYELSFLEGLVKFGVENNYFSIEDVTNPEVVYSAVDWRSDNVYQEILLGEDTHILDNFFSKDRHIPKEFKKFVLDKY
ncbi:hypothetical protein [Enterococcus sp. LJL51]|uniref:hypothetical protein n=1 Tax=Enterococcus sp. LJL51 TaxID=3416656 RepID=UPI003CEC5240